ncbi:hypothetical protein ABFS82_12G030500 [Erythranthe guttata]
MFPPTNLLPPSLEMKKCWKSPCSWVVVIQGRSLCMLHFGKCQSVLTASGLLCSMQDASISSTGFMNFLFMFGNLEWIALIVFDHTPIFLGGRRSRHIFDEVWRKSAAYFEA